MKITRTICTPSTDITVEIKLLPSEVEAAYREQEETFRLLDAERQLCEYLHFNVRDYDKGDREDAEALKSFKTEFGDIEPRSLVDESSPNYVLPNIVAKYERRADCNIDENTVWQTVIHDVLNELCVPVLPAETNA